MTQFICKDVKQINNQISLNMTFTFTIRISRRFSSARQFQIGNFHKYWSQNVGQDFFVISKSRKIAPAGRFTCMLDYNYLCNQCLSPLMLCDRISIRERYPTLCDKVCQWLETGRWFSPGPPVSSTNKTDWHNITEILLKVVLKHHQANKQHRFCKLSDYNLKLWTSFNTHVYVQYYWYSLTLQENLVHEWYKKKWDWSIHSRFSY
jgi:hypothetical protein